MAKTLEYWIDLEGIEKGTKKYNAIQKAIEKKKAKYASQPYKRLTREWFIWRYGECEGIEKFNTFARKSAHTLENFSRLYGEELGREKYNETIAKKNTNSVESIMNRTGLSRDEAEKIRSTIFEKTRCSISLEGQKQKYGEVEGTDRYNAKVESSRKKFEKLNEFFKGRKKIDAYREKFGEEQGEIEYNKLLEKQFLGPNRATKPVSDIYNRLITEIPDSVSLIKVGIGSLKEFYLYDNLLKRYYLYDISLPSLKIILEYDGKIFHPTLEEAIVKSDQKMIFGAHTYKSKYDYDQRKIKYAIDNGFNVFIIREDFDQETINQILKDFFKLIKERINDVQIN